MTRRSVSLGVPSAALGRSSSSTVEITQLLRAWSAGDHEAAERLFEAVYPRLRRLVAARLAAAREPHQTTDIVNDLYLRLERQRRVAWSDRNHFFAIAARVVRRVLVDHARGRSTLRRGAGPRLVGLHHVSLAADAPTADLLTLDRALDELAAINLTALRVVELRCFGGLTLDETAATMGVGRATAVRGWRFARNWLVQRLRGP